MVPKQPSGSNNGSENDRQNAGAWDERPVLLVRAMQQTPEHYVPERMDRPVRGPKSNGIRVRITPQGKTQLSRVRGTNGITGTVLETPGGLHDRGPPIID